MLRWHWTPICVDSDAMLVDKLTGGSVVLYILMEGNIIWQQGDTRGQG